MLQLASIERGTWAKLLIVTYLAAYFAVTLLKLVQTLCILGLVMLCVWDQVLVGLIFGCDPRSHELSDEPDSLKYHDEMLQFVVLED